MMDNVNDTVRDQRITNINLWLYKISPKYHKKS